jgi:hypothetical protein
MHPLQAIQLIKQIDLHEAKKRIPIEYGNVSFFGENDEWLYISSYALAMCDVCGGYDNDHYFGPDLRGAFPYLTIIDENNIYAGVHPHCGCILSRVGYVERVNDSGTVEESPLKMLPQKIKLPDSEFDDWVNGLLSLGYIAAATADLLHRKKKKEEEDKQK